MSVEIIKTEDLNELRQMFSTTCEIARSESLKNKKLLLTAEEVAEITGYHASTIKKKKKDIGYRIGFTYQDVKFLYEDVVAWVNRGYNPPKPLPTHKK